MKTYLVTGANGFLGKAIIQTIILKEPESRIIAFVRTEDRVDPAWKENKNISVMPFDFSQNEKGIEELKRQMAAKCMGIDSIDYIFHCASVTNSKKIVNDPINTMDTIVEGTRLMLELAAESNCKSMVYLSSMEVYGYVPKDCKARTENELGDLRMDDIRNSYPLAKRMAEIYCYSYAKTRNLPVKVARLAQIFGKYTNVEDSRVFMQFARSVKKGLPIELMTKGESFGNYCSTTDALSAVFCILEKGINGETYNVVNESNTMTIRQMAELVSRTFSQGKSNVVIHEKDRKETGYAIDTGLHMSAGKLRQLGWEPKDTLIDMFSEVISLL